MVQIKLEEWHSGRVVLLGDAAHCPSPLTGLGTTSSLVGVYVLAGEITRNAELEAAFQKYTDRMRPYIDTVQQFNSSVVRVALSDSQWVINIIHFILRLVCFLHIPQLVSRFLTDRDGDWELPEYSELENDRE